MTSTQSSETQILKVDSRERVRTSKQRREAILDEFERSGLSGAAFAKLHGIKYSTFASWSLKRRKAQRSATASRPAESSESPTLAEIIIEETSIPHAWDAPVALRVHLPGGAWIQLDGPEAQAKLAVQLIKALQV